MIFHKIPHFLQYFAADLMKTVKQHFAKNLMTTLKHGSLHEKLLVSAKSAKKLQTNYMHLVTIAVHSTLDPNTVLLKVIVIALLIKPLQPCG